jgi:L-lactate dehydrogenase complex protein LldG
VRAAADDLFTLFAARAEPLGVSVLRATNAEGAAPLIESLAREVGADRPLVTTELAAAAPALIAALAARGLEGRSAGAPNESRDAPLGLSLARLAVAETGSVLLAEPSLDDRGIGLLVATQLVVCPTTALVASLDEAVSILREVARQPGGGYATLVTGPSRTADIERVLTVGVQGPARLAVLFVERLA